MFTSRARVLQVFWVPGTLTVSHVNESTVTATEKANFYPFPPSLLRPDVGPECYCHLVAAIKTDNSLLPVWPQCSSGTFCHPLN